MSRSSNQIVLTESIHSSSPPQQLNNNRFEVPSSSKRINSLLSKLYKQASELYLTRRLPECLAILEPSIFPWKSAEGDDDEVEDMDNVLIAVASRSLRIKVWNLYLTLLNDVLNLGASEGRCQIGNNKWSKLALSVHNGTVWDQVVKVGYGGLEMKVDADVVVNLSSLLLAQCDSQALNQERLETYLSGWSSSYLDISQDLCSIKPTPSRHRSSMEGDQSTQSLRDLNSRIKILEIYTLHVLPCNDQWRFAQDFISASYDLDVETKESFLQILDNLEKESFERIQVESTVFLPAKLDKEQEVGTNERQAYVKTASERMDRSIEDQGLDLENDYGIEDRPRSPILDRHPSPILPRPIPCSRPSTTRKSTGHKKLIAHGNTIRSILQRIVFIMSNSFSKQPMQLMRFVLFLIGLILAFSRRDLRGRAEYLLHTGWEKLRRTAGMGVKVSYL